MVIAAPGWHNVICLASEPGWGGRGRVLCLAPAALKLPASCRVWESCMYDTRASLGQLLRCAALNSLQAKAFRVEDGQLEPVCQLLFGAVGRQQQAVEAGVAGGQAVAVGAVALRGRTAGHEGQPVAVSGSTQGVTCRCDERAQGHAANAATCPPGPAPPLPSPG